MRSSIVWSIYFILCMSNQLFSQSTFAQITEQEKRQRATENPLWLSLRYNDAALLKQAIARGIDVNQRILDNVLRRSDCLWQAPYQDVASIQRAVCAPCPYLVALLINAGAQVNVPSFDESSQKTGRSLFVERTPLEILAMFPDGLSEKQQVVAKMLLIAGADYSRVQVRKGLIEQNILPLLPAVEAEKKRISDERTRHTLQVRSVFEPMGDAWKDLSEIVIGYISYNIVEYNPEPRDLKVKTEDDYTEKPCWIDPQRIYRWRDRGGSKE
jgi:hypothetical protein